MGSRDNLNGQLKPHVHFNFNEPVSWNFKPRPLTMANETGLGDEGSILSREVGSEADTRGDGSQKASKTMLLNSVDLPRLSEEQRARIAINRERALSLRKARINARPYQLKVSEGTRSAALSTGARAYEDTRGGFVLEENPVEQDRILQLRSKPVVQDDCT